MPRRSETPSRDVPDMTNAELNRERSEAVECFDQALAQKAETDRIYVAAATRLNTLDRMVKKVEQRAAVNRRAAARLLLRTL
jgi:hypothetical protein